MGMFSWKCKGCGEELCSGEHVRLNGKTQEYDGYGGSAASFDSDYDPEAWHERCYQHASETLKRDGKSSPHAPNQGFGPSKLEAMEHFDPEADTKYFATVDAYYSDWRQGEDSPRESQRYFYYLTTDGLVDEEQWRKDREAASEAIDTSDSPDYKDKEAYEEYWRKHGELVDAQVGTNPNSRLRYFDSIEEAIAGADSLLHTLPERLEGEHTLTIHGKQEKAEGAVYNRNRSRYNKELAEKYGTAEENVEDGQLYDKIEDWTGLAARALGREPVYDRFDHELVAGDFLDVQKAGVHRTFEFQDELCFTPYGKVQRVRDYFRNDIVYVAPEDVKIAE